MDPPWPNKSVKRAQTYKTASLRYLLTLSSSVRALACQEFSIIVIWVTNDPAIVEFAKNELIPAWGYRFVTTWWWIKVTATGTPVFPPGGTHKNPYERALVAVAGRLSGRVATQSVDTERMLRTIAALPSMEPRPLPTDIGSIKEESGSELINNQFKAKLCEDNAEDKSSCLVPINVVVSVPLRHSWKPPLHGLAYEFVRSAIEAPCGAAPAARKYDDIRVLEMFARYYRIK